MMDHKTPREAREPREPGETIIQNGTILNPDTSSK
jgi:hypothetical protein